MPRLTRSLFFALLIAAIGCFAAAAHAVQLQTRVEVPSVYKSCHAGTECVVVVISCPGYNLCCDYDSINVNREDDYNRLNVAQCKQGQYKEGTARIDLQACTICEPLSSHASDCINNMCVRKNP